MRFASTRFGWIGPALLAAAALGCGDDSLDVYPVRGKITFDGKPIVGGGSIAFMPTTEQEGKMAGGTITEDGAYEMSTYAEGDGSIPGEFRVVIVQVVETEPEATQDGQAPAEASGASVAQSDRIPAIYSDPYNSPLTATVEAKDLNEANFDLQRQP